MTTEVPPRGCYRRGRGQTLLTQEFDMHSDNRHKTPDTQKFQADGWVPAFALTATPGRLAHDEVLATHERSS